MRPFHQQLHRDLAPALLWGYQGAFPGPSFEGRRGQAVRVTWRNGLPDQHPLPIDTQVHGAERDKAAVRTVVHLHVVQDAIRKASRAVVLPHPALGRIRAVDLEGPLGRLERRQQPEVVQRGGDEGLFVTVVALLAPQLQGAEQEGAHAMIEQIVRAAGARVGGGRE